MPYPALQSRFVTCGPKVAGGQGAFLTGVAATSRSWSVETLNNEVAADAIGADGCGWGTAAGAVRAAGGVFAQARSRLAAFADTGARLAEERTADDAAYWLAQATPAWPDAVPVVAVGMCSIYASAVRRMLPGTQIAVVLSHVIHLAVKMTGDVRCCVARGKYGRSSDPKYGIKHLLVRNLEDLSHAQFAKIIGTLQADPAWREIPAARIAKEKLRHSLNPRARVTGSAPCERNIRDRLFAFDDWCAQNDDIPELASLATTISRWEDEIVRAVLTGVTNASESLNRLAKLEARLVYGFRNPASPRRCVRIATPADADAHHTPQLGRERPVTGPKPNPGYGTWKSHFIMSCSIPRIRHQARSRPGPQRSALGARKSRMSR